MSRSSGITDSGVTNPGTAGTENNALEIWTPGYYGYTAWNGDPARFVGSGSTATQLAWAYRIYCPKAFTLTKAAIFCTAGTALTAANDTTVAVGSNGVDVSTFAGAGTLNVVATTATPGNFATTAGTLIVDTSNGKVLMTYTNTTATTFTGVTTLQGGTGTLATGGHVNQSYNQMAIFNNAGTSMLGISADRVTQWSASGLDNVSLTIPAGTSAAVTASSYLWLVHLVTGTVPSFLQATANVTRINHASLSAAQFRVGKIGTTNAYFPAPSGSAGVNTFVPASLTSTGTNSPGEVWVAVT